MYVLWDLQSYSDVTLNIGEGIPLVHRCTQVEQPNYRKPARRLPNMKILSALDGILTHAMRGLRDGKSRDIILLATAAPPYLF